MVESIYIKYLPIHIKCSHESYVYCRQICHHFLLSQTDVLQYFFITKKCQKASEVVICPVCRYEVVNCPVCKYEVVICPVCKYEVVICPVCKYEVVICPVCRYEVVICPV